MNIIVFQFEFFVFWQKYVLKFMFIQSNDLEMYYYKNFDQG